MHLPLAAGIEDVLQVLFVLVIFLGPVLARIFRERKETGQVPRTRPPQPPRSTPPVTWRDLLEGRIETPRAQPPPAPPPPPPAPPPAQREPPAVPAARPSAGPYSMAGEGAMGGDPYLFASEDLVPDSDLAPVPSEEELEGGFVASSGTSEVLSQAAPALELVGARRTDAGPGHFPPARSELRRAVILSEVFGSPVGLRRGLVFEGPHASQL